MGMSAEANASELPLVAALVTAGLSQPRAEPITDSIFRVRDVANVYLVTTADGDVLINAGLMDNIESNKAKLAPHRTGPLRRIILTQAHADHYGGTPSLRETQTQVIAGQRFTDTWNYFHDLGPYLERRIYKLWGMTFQRDDNAPKVPKVVPDIAVEGKYSFEQGGRRFELIATPGGETLCSISVWMPEERVALVGNLFGPVLPSMPFLTTTRGDRPRLAQRFLDSLDTVRNLGAEILVAGHSEPVRGAKNVRAVLDKLHAAVSFVKDATIEGMNAGKDVHTLMREIRLPDALKIGEYHGNVRWAVRAIWEENSGWFHYDSTTSLYGVPRASIDSDLAELAGGATALAERARQKLERNLPLEALHLLDVALGAEPANTNALGVKNEVLQRLLAQAGNINVSEVMWLRSEITLTDIALVAADTPR
jgi:alkyl sulfatase BDS1-like metallo-beta-lactamase superfamily hydrolase